MSFGNAHTIHAREHHMGWNPANTPVQTVAPGDTVEFDCIDSSGGQITENTVATDLASVDWTQFAPLTGPLAGRWCRTRGRTKDNYRVLPAIWLGMECHHQHLRHLE